VLIGLIKSINFPDIKKAGILASLMVNDIVIRDMNAKDWEAVRKIYRQGIAGGNATFEQQAPTWEQWDANHLPDCRLVALQGKKVVGWAVLTPVSMRRVYAGVAELSIYVDQNSRRQGIGARLLAEVIAETEARGIWTLQGSIFPENSPSLRLCFAQGFRQVGTRERIGQMKGEWRDTVLIERRSKVAGN